MFHEENRERYDELTSLQSCIRLLALVAFASAFVHAVACSDSGLGGGPAGTDDDGEPALVPDARVGDGDVDKLQTTARIAHLAPDLGPVDFCYRASQNGTFIGPVVGGNTMPNAAGGEGGLDAEAGSEDAATNPADAGGPQLPYRSMSKYFTLSASGKIDIAIVKAGSASCGKPVLQGDVTLDPGKLYTVVLLGWRDSDAGPALDVLGFTDDRTLVADKARVRVIHAALGIGNTAPAGPLAARVAGAKAEVLAERVEPRKASTASQSIPVDALGYAKVDPLTPPASLVVSTTPDAGAGPVEAGTQTWQSSAIDLDLRGGTLHTAFVLSAENAPFEVLWCADTITRAERTACVVVP